MLDTLLPVSICNISFNLINVAIKFNHKCFAKRFKMLLKLNCFYR